MSAPIVIDRVRLDAGRMPVQLVFSYGTVQTFPFTIVRLYANGCVGMGEVVVPHNPFLENLLGTLLGTDARKLDALLPATDTDLDRIVCEAVSIALFDLVATVAELPLHALLGGAPEHRVPLMPCLFPRSAPEAQASARTWLEQGYDYLKVKLVGDHEEDLARIRAIREAAPAELVLQGDANEGYTTIPAAARAVAAFGAAGLDVFEDPLAGDARAYAELRRLRPDHGAAIMVDKLARRTTDLLSVIRLEAADAVGIHPDQPGSLTRALVHARLAAAAGFKVVIGGTGYTGVASAAYQHLTAVATPGGPCGELGGAFDHGMPRSMIRAPLPMQDGAVLLPERPGMGTELDQDTLAEYGEQSRTWE